ncbi:hypothetical protein VTN00DRAFT_5069 [Thermoascus crustaceus]|uniref:uncharacterized protein n=1 Tax=Thermoascus crustaceus TaxID=5088 RepID=UPI003742977E
MDGPNPEPPVIDEFAQTRGVDDLFDDEIIPVPAEQQQQQFEDVRDSGQEKVEHDTQREDGDAPQRFRGGERGRGRGRGRGGRGGRASHDRGPNRAETNLKSKQGENVTEVTDKDADNAAQSQGDKTAEETKGKTGSEATTSPSKSSGASNGHAPPRVQAVRGDRSGTGGIKKPKLTEEELSKRMAAAKLNAAKIAAAHARAEADQASFQERERIAQEKRRQEYLNRRAMDGERERNRLRKLNAQTGREWDAEKQEEDYNPRGPGSQYRRGMHGGVSGYTRRGYENGAEVEVGSHNGYRGRGRGGRGGRGRGGPRGSRGDHSSNGDHSRPATAERTTPSTPGIGDEKEFPALPGGSKKESQIAGPPAVSVTTSTGESPAPGAEKAPSPLSPLTPTGGTWAEQVESSKGKAQ